MTGSSRAFSQMSGPSGPTGSSTSNSGGDATAYYEPETLLEVSVGKPTRVGGHIEYLVVVESNLPQFPPRSERWHRYSDFVKLREGIRRECPQAQVPPLPGKHFGLSSELTPAELAERVAGLERFLSGAVTHPLINTRSHSLLGFLQ